MLFPASEMGQWLSMVAVAGAAGTTCPVSPHIPTPALGRGELSAPAWRETQQMSLGARRVRSLLVPAQRGRLAAAWASSSPHPSALPALGAGTLFSSGPWQSVVLPVGTAGSWGRQCLLLGKEGSWGTCVFVCFLLEKVERVPVRVLVFQLA